MASEYQMELGELVDSVLADGVVLRAFMLSVSVELARTKPDPVAWMTGFISILHARVDVNEQNTGAIALRAPVHELARKTFDNLGRGMEKILNPPPGSQSSR